MKWFSRILLASTALISFVVFSQDTGQNTGNKEGYMVLKKKIIGGDGSWDYLTVSPETRRLYIARETRVMILDMDTMNLIQEITNLKGVHGIALVPELSRLFISIGLENKIGIYDLKTLEKIGEAKAGVNPDAIIYDAISHRIFAFNHGGTTTTAIDAKTGELVGNVELGGVPEFAVSDGKGHVYVNIEDKSEVVEIDSIKMVVLNHQSLAPGKTPTGLAIDTEHRRLFSSCHDTNTVVVMDADNGIVLACLPIGERVDALAFDPETQTIFTSNGEGTMTVIHEDSPDKFQIVQTVATQTGARTLALDVSKHQIWLVTAETKPAPENQGKKRRIVLPDTFAALVVGKN